MPPPLPRWGLLRVDQTYGAEPQPGQESSPEGHGNFVRDGGIDDDDDLGPSGNVGLDSAAGAGAAAAAVPPGVFRAVWDDNNK